jgi:hypothetical protein
MSTVDVLIHTESPVAPTRLFHVQKGWFGHEHGHAHELNVERRRFLPCCAKSVLHVEEAHKWDWLHATSHAHTSANLTLAVDTDSFFQCKAPEIHARFRRYDVPLLIGAEKHRFPQPELSPPPRASLKVSTRPRTRGHLIDPFPPTRSELRYPNAGTIMGTRAGISALWRALHQIPSYPCCPAPLSATNASNAVFSLPAARGAPSTERRTARCIVDSQACLHAALASMPREAYAIDTNGSVFLSMYGVEPSDLSIAPRSRKLVYAPTGVSPCVLHFNGEKFAPASAPGQRRLPYRSPAHRVVAAAASPLWLPQVSASATQYINSRSRHTSHLQSRAF